MSYETRTDINFRAPAGTAGARLFLMLVEDAVRLLGVDENREPVFFRAVQLDRDQAEAGVGLRSWLDDQQAWINEWKELVVIHHCPQATIVPAALFGNDNGRELLDLQFGDLFKGTMLAEKIPGRRDYALYRIPADRYMALSSAHPNIRHVHLYSAWLPVLENLPVSGEGEAFLLFEDQRVVMALRKDGWRTITQFEYLAPEDACYYLLAAMQESGLHPGSATIYVEGWLDKDSSLYQELNKYIRNLRTPGLVSGPGLDETSLEGQPLHYFTPLINMALCGS